MLLVSAISAHLKSSIQCSAPRTTARVALRASSLTPTCSVTFTRRMLWRRAPHAYCVSACSRPRRRWSITRKRRTLRPLWAAPGPSAAGIARKVSKSAPHWSAMWSVHTRCHGRTWKTAERWSAMHRKTTKVSAVWAYSFLYSENSSDMNAAYYKRTYLRNSTCKLGLVNIMLFVLTSVKDDL